MAVNQAALKAGLEKGVAYLAHVQRSDGGFDSYSSPSKLHFKKSFTYQTTFVPAVMLAALSKVEGPPARQVSLRLADFVHAQHSSDWSFNYWAVASPERQVRPYPDDLDDTACALIGLLQTRPALVGPDVLAAFVKLLLAAETQVGGPYRTWLTATSPAGQWADVDVAVNANIAYLLSLVSQPLPNLTALMEEAIRDAKLTSPYYVSAHALIYYLARAYRGPLTGRLRQQIHSLLVPEEQATPLQNALLLSALLHLADGRVAGLAARLLASQRRDGSWPAEAFCLDPARNGAIHYHGSESLTTALALEALQLYQGFVRTALQEKPEIPKTATRPYASFRSRVLAANLRQWRQLPAELGHSGLDFSRRLSKAAINQEIVTLAPAFNDSLAEPLGKIYQPALVQLSLANVYGWTAYTIYDDFLDEEGRPALLPAANAALRYCLEAFAAAVPDDEEFKNYIRQAFDTIDGANAWELAHCRFKRSGPNLLIGTLPDYGDLTGLAQRSLGHSLTPLAVLRLKGLRLEGQSFQRVQQAFIHYLTAKQLNDDAHDWQTDLEKGHVSCVAAQLLASSRVKSGSQKWEALLPALQEQFWYQMLPAVCHDITDQTALSRRCLKGMPELKQTNILTRLLDSIDVSVGETLAAQSRTETFLGHYKSTVPAAT